MIEIRAPYAVLRAQIAVVLAAWGMEEHQAAVTAEVMAEADLTGVDSHGLSMLMLYGRMLRAGQLRIDAEPSLVRETATTALYDAGAGLGHYPSVVAMNQAIAKAAEHDVSVITVCNSNHHGALGYYARMATERGFFTLVTSSGKSTVVLPTFGAERRLGTSPIAFGAPAGDRNPSIVLDMACAVAAANKVKMHALKGDPIPEGWMLGADMQPLTDAAVANDLIFNSLAGGLNPLGGAGTLLGGHKGYGLAVFTHLLGGALAGAAFPPLRALTQQPSDPDNIGHFFMVLKPAAIRPVEDYRRDFDAFVDCLRATRPADPARPVLLPGDPERACRARRMEEGIPLPAALLRAIRIVAEEAGAPFLLAC